MNAPLVAIFIHGGFYGGWCWVRVARELRARGWDVYTPSLTGLADRAHLLSPAIDIDTHTEDVVNRIEAGELSGIVMCGHSAGGAVITGAADRVPARLKALVYLDASLLGDGQSMLDFMGDTQGAPALFRKQAAESGDGWKIPVGIPFDASGFGIDDPHDAAWVNRRITAHPLAAFDQPLKLTGAWERVPTRLTERWDTGHSPHITEPKRVVAAIKEMESV